jgi:lysine 2,3-aminomutase
MDDAASLLQLSVESSPLTKGTSLDDKDEEPPSQCIPIINVLPKTPKPCLETPRSTAGLSYSQKRIPRKSDRTKAFRECFYGHIPDIQWNDWHWQINNRIRNIPQLEQLLALSYDEKTAMDPLMAMLPVGITPYCLSLIPPDDPVSPLPRTVVPTISELFRTPEEADDPLGEAFDYIASDSRIRDVLISIGDPLTLSDDCMNWILSDLRRIPHVEIVRIGTKIPAVLPQRITPQLARMLRKYHPILMSLHFTHPDECTPGAYRACPTLTDAGIPFRYPVSERSDS